MPDKYAYVNPSTGVDSPGRSNTNAVTAASTPYLTLPYAEADNRQNLTTLGGSFLFRLLGGTDSIAVSVEILSANWPGSSAANRVRFHGTGTGRHGGLFTTGTGYTLNYSGSYSAFLHDDVSIEIYGIRLRNTNANYAYAHTSGYGAADISQCMLYTAGGQTVVTLGGAAADRRLIMTNCALLSDTDICIFADAYNSDAIYLDHNTFVGNHATAPIVSVADAQRLRWNYSHNKGAGAAYGGAGWAGSTRLKNASGDSSGDSTYTAKTYSIASGAYFTSVTAGSENFDIGTSSTLRNLGTDSSETVDALNRPRTTPDLGAFEFQASSAPIITDCGDELHRVGEVGIVIAGSNFGATQGTGFVKIAPSNDVNDANAVSQTITAWGDTSITFNVVASANLARNTNLYLFVRADAGASNASGYVIQITHSAGVLASAVLMN